MDTTDYPSLSRLARTNAQLFVDNLAISMVVEGQLDSVDRLFRAATNRDWEALLRLSEELASELQDRADKSMVKSARKLRDSLERDPSGARATRPLAELLAACREAKIRRGEP